MENLDAKLQKIDELTRTGYNVEIGKYIGEAWEIFKKDPGSFIGFFFVTAAISLVLGFIPFLGSMASMVISPALGIGNAIVARKIKKEEPYSFNDFFGGFQKFGELFLGNLIVLIMVVIGFALLILPGIYLAIAYAFVSMFIFFAFDGGYWSTLERCRKFVTKEWFNFFAFFIVLVILNMAGALCLLVGLLVTIPVSGIALYVAYESLIGTEDDGTDIISQIEKIG